jgi:hypothetical protein
VAHWKAPPAEHEEPQPEAGEIVSFLALHERGLGTWRTRSFLGC